MELGSVYGAGYGVASSSIPNRCELRLPATLNVRVLGMDANGKPFHQPAMTTEISASGVRITGLVAKLAKGDIVGLQSGGGKNRFKVSWVKTNRDGTHQLGLRCLEKGGAPWRERLKPASKGEDHRSGDRYPCHGSVCLRSSPQRNPVWAMLKEVSASGCYVQSVQVWAPGETLSGEFTINNVQVNAIVEVRSSVAGVGMGLLWCDLGVDGKARLTRALRELGAKSIDPNSSKAKMVSHLDKVHQLLVAFRECLEEELPITPEALAQLSHAEEKLTAALRCMQP